MVSYETVRRWGIKFVRITPADCAASSTAETMSGTWTRSSSSSPAGTLVMARRRLGWLWLRDRPEPPQDQSGQALAVAAAEEARRRAEAHDHPQVRSYEAARRKIMPKVEHRSLCARYTYSPPAGQGGMASSGSGQLTSAAAGLNGFICRQRDFVGARHQPTGGASRRPCERTVRRTGPPNAWH